MLKEFPPGLDGPLMHRLHALADQLVACGNEAEMVHVCLEMRHYLNFVILSVHEHMMNHAGSEVVEAVAMSGLLERTAWAFTWVETLLLERDMLWDTSQEAYGPNPWESLRDLSSGSDLKAMRRISSRWGMLHSLWLPFSGDLELTIRALDLHRRLALLCCGQDTEAVENFQAPDYWKGFELCYLCSITSEIYHTWRVRGRRSLAYGTADLSQIENRCLYWLQRAERAVPRATERGHEHQYWPLVRLKVLQVQAETLGLIGRREDSKEVVGKVKQEIQRIDLQLRFDFPVPLPDIQYLKWDILQRLTRHFHRSVLLVHTGLVPEIGPEVLDMLDVARSDSQTLYALACLVLRGQQLISYFNMVEKGLDLLETCLARLAHLPHCECAVGVAWPGGLEGAIIMDCYITIFRDLTQFVALDRVDRLVGFLAAQGYPAPPPYVTNSFMRKAWAVCGFSGPATFMPGSVVPALSPSKAVLDAFWESYKHSCTAIRLQYKVGKHLSTDNKVRLFRSWFPYKLLFCIHAVAATVSQLLAPNAEAESPEGPLSPGTASREAGHGEFARQALLALESARNYKGKEFGAVNDWEWIKRAHRACGPGALFVQFAGRFEVQEITMGPGMFDVCIVVQDEGVASCHRLERIDSDSILENVRDISDACREMKLESECCRNALETVYDLLIRPLFHTFIRQSDADRNGNPHPYRNRKLVISAIGCFKDVPFSILRNKDSGCYLFQEVKLAFTPSFAMLDLCRLRYESLQERPLLAGAGAAVALGDPQYLPYQQEPLPGTRIEVDAICQVFDFCHPEYEIVKLLDKNATPQRLLDKNATPQRLLECVKMPSAGAGSGTQCSQAFVHIAAHGSGGKESDHGTIFLSTVTTQTRRRRRRRAAAQGAEGEGEGKGKGKEMRDECASSDAESASSDEESYEPEAALSSDALLLGHHMLPQQAFESHSAAEVLDKFLPRLLRSRSSDVETSLRCDDIMLSGLEWCAYMVVLSACNTGVGVIHHKNDFDILSFSRAFMSAGVPCSVLAQWPVDDNVALHLMKLFYEALSQGEDACSALQSAMIKMLQTGNYTLYQIAPFVVTGLPTVCLPPQMRRGPASELTSISKPQTLLMAMKFSPALL